LVGVWRTAGQAAIQPALVMKCPARIGFPFFYLASLGKEKEESLATFPLKKILFSVQYRRGTARRPPTAK
ncbi:hypothetical protein VU11_07565, partial [Desulfobulbus sp. US2]|nr:hypothetical protein [Desulfobulbus sp. US2]